MFNIRSREEGNGRGRKLIDTCFQEGKIVKSKKRGARVSLRSDRWIPIAWEWTAVHSPPRGLSYVSHFDVSRQHVTRVFTNGGRRACEGRGRRRRRARTRTCTHIGGETARMRRCAPRIRGGNELHLCSSDDERRRQRGRCGFYVCIMGHVYAPPSGIHSVYTARVCVHTRTSHFSTFNLPTKLDLLSKASLDYASCEIL